MRVRKQTHQKWLFPVIIWPRYMYLTIRCFPRTRHETWLKGIPTQFQTYVFQCQTRIYSLLEIVTVQFANGKSSKHQTTRMIINNLCTRLLIIVIIITTLGMLMIHVSKPFRLYILHTMVSIFNFPFVLIDLSFVHL